jgi:toxin ParE1/3/4
LTEYHTTARAKSDLLKIGRFTQQRWGRKTRIKYLARVDSACSRLAINPSLGRNRDELLPGASSFPVGRHLIIYRVADTGLIEIIRVLHQSMDYQKSLSTGGSRFRE